MKSARKKKILTTEWTIVREEVNYNNNMTNMHNEEEENCNNTEDSKYCEE